MPCTRFLRRSLSRLRPRAGANRLLIQALWIGASFGASVGAMTAGRSETIALLPTPPSAQAAPATVKPGSPAILTRKPAAPAAAKSAIVDLARYLKSIGAKMYGAYWCPHCHHQKELFGEATFKAHINYIECAEDGQNAQPKLCRDKKITGYPTWEINGKFYQGTRSLDELANLSGYKGSRNF